MENIKELMCHPERVLVQANVDIKNHYQLTKDVEIIMERDIENYNGREKNAVQGIVLFGDGLILGSEVLVDHNSLHDTNKVFHHNLNLPKNNYLYAVPKTEVFAYRKDGKWMPYTGFLFVEKIFEPYGGILLGVPPNEIKNILFCVDGEYKHQALMTENHCFYTIIYQDESNREAHISRMRNNEFELIGVHHGITEKVISGEFIIGETCDNATKFII